MTDDVRSSGIPRYCPDCGTESGGAPKCANCGVDLTAFSRQSSEKGAVGRGILWGGVVVLLGGSLAIAGSFLPWISSSAAFVRSRNGIDGGGDGIYTIVVGLVVALFGLALVARSGRPLLARLGALVASVFLGYLAWTQIGSVNERIAALDTDVPGGSVGIGLYVILIGALLGILGALVRHRSSR